MATPTPTPSDIRTVRIYPGGRGPSMGLLGPNAILTWSPKHPLESDWWWVDASGWLVDPSGTPWDTIGMVAKQVIGPDAALTVAKTFITSDGLHAGFLLSGGTPGTDYLIRPVLSGEVTGRSWSQDIRIRVAALAPVTPNPGDLATVRGSVVTIGGLRWPIPS